MKIDDNIVKQTTLCVKDFKCLREIKCSKLPEKSCLKNVVCCISDYFFVVECTEIDCPYFLNYGGKSICHCPTRLAVYKKYNI